MRSCFFYLFISLSAFSVCSCQKHSPPESNFFKTFSLAQIAERVKAPELVPQSGGAGTSTSHGETTRARRDFDLIFTIDEREGARFDENSFIKKLNDEIQRVINQAGVHVHGGGNGDDSFHFDFSEGNHEGWLEVTGARVEGNKYKLWGVIRENTEMSKE